MSAESWSAGFYRICPGCQERMDEDVWRKAIVEKLVQCRSCRHWSGSGNWVMGWRQTRRLRRSP